MSTFVNFKIYSCFCENFSNLKVFCGNLVIEFGAEIQKMDFQISWRLSPVAGGCSLFLILDLSSLSLRVTVTLISLQIKLHIKRVFFHFPLSNSIVHSSNTSESVRAWEIWVFLLYKKSISEYAESHFFYGGRWRSCLLGLSFGSEKGEIFSNDMERGANGD